MWSCDLVGKSCDPAVELRSKRPSEDNIALGTIVYTNRWMGEGVTERQEGKSDKSERRRAREN